MEAFMKDLGLELDCEGRGDLIEKRQHQVRDSTYSTDSQEVFMVVNEKGRFEKQS